MIITTKLVKKWVDNKIAINIITTIPIECKNCGFRDILGKCLFKVTEFEAWGLQHQKKIE